MSDPATIKLAIEAQAAKDAAIRDQIMKEEAAKASRKEEDPENVRIQKMRDFILPSIQHYGHDGEQVKGAGDEYNGMTILQPQNNLPSTNQGDIAILYLLAAGIVQEDSVTKIAKDRRPELLPHIISSAKSWIDYKAKGKLEGVELEIVVPINLEVWHHGQGGSVTSESTKETAIVGVTPYFGPEKIKSLSDAVNRAQEDAIRKKAQDESIPTAKLFGSAGASVPANYNAGEPTALDVKKYKVVKYKGLPITGDGSTLVSCYSGSTNDVSYFQSSFAFANPQMEAHLFPVHNAVQATIFGAQSYITWRTHQKNLAGVGRACKYLKERFDNDAGYHEDYLNSLAMHTSVSSAWFTLYQDEAIAKKNRFFMMRLYMTNNDQLVFYSSFMPLTDFKKWTCDDRSFVYGSMAISLPMFQYFVAPYRLKVNAHGRFRRDRPKEMKRPDGTTYTDFEGTLDAALNKKEGSLSSGEASAASTLWSKFFTKYLHVSSHLVVYKPPAAAYLALTKQTAKKNPSIYATVAAKVPKAAPAEVGTTVTTPME